MVSTFQYHQHKCHIYDETKEKNYSKTISIKLNKRSKCTTKIIKVEKDLNELKVLVRLPLPINLKVTTIESTKEENNNKTIENVANSTTEDDINTNKVRIVIDDGEKERDNESKDKMENEEEEEEDLSSRDHQNEDNVKDSSDDVSVNPENEVVLRVHYRGQIYYLDSEGNPAELYVTGEDDGATVVDDAVSKAISEDLESVPFQPDDAENYRCVLPKGSTKKILSLVKNLPEKGKLETSLRGLNNEKFEKRRRFNKHPRRMKLHSESAESFDKVVVIKKPSNLTDSSDEFCDVTIRKDDVALHQDGDIEISDTILENVESRLNKSKYVLDKLYTKNQAMMNKSIEKIPECKDEKNQKKDINEKRKKKYQEERMGETKLYLDKKLSAIIEKSTLTLEEIRTMMSYGIELPDGSEDFERRKKRAMEFASRFSRIHLYELNRHVSDIQQGLKRSNPIIMNQKYFTAHHTVFLALQAYLKHLPTSTAMGVPEKLKELLKVCNGICDIFKEHCDDAISIDTGNPIEIFHDRCQEMLGNLEENVFNSSLKDERNKLAMMGYAPKQLKRKNGKLSMYHHSVPIRKDVYWKKAVAALAEKKFNVPSRYRTATYKHRPVAPKTPIKTDDSTRSKSHHGRFPEKRPVRSKGRLERPTTRNDIDNVTTLMQAQEEKDLKQTSSVCEEQNVMWNMAKGFYQKIGKENQTMSQSEYECILEHFMSVVQTDLSDTSKTAIGGDGLEQAAQELLEVKLGKPIEKMDFKEFVEKLVECANSNSACDLTKKLSLTDVKSGNESLPLTVVSEAHSHKTISRKESKLSVKVSGSKNAKLIWIKDDNSPTEASDDEKKSVKKKTSIKSLKSSQRNSQNELIYKEVADKEGKKMQALARVNKQNLRQLEMLPKDSVLSILQYKIEFHKETKNNYMYKRMGNLSPWILMEKIADKLMDESLQSIVRDIQVDEILQKIYKSELN